MNQAAGIMDEVSNMASKDGTAELELNISKLNNLYSYKICSFTVA